MEERDYREWLDSWVDIIHKQKSLKTFANDVTVINHFDEVQISGLEIVADELGIECTTVKRECLCYPCEISFVYKGVKFFHLIKKENYIDD